MDRPCTNHFLPIGHQLTDLDGNTIAVLNAEHCFVDWQAGTWAAKQIKAKAKAKAEAEAKAKAKFDTARLVEFQKALKAARLRAPR